MYGTVARELYRGGNKESGVKIGGTTGIIRNYSWRQDTSKGTALWVKGQLISPGEIPAFAQNVKRGHVGLMTVTLRPTVKEISSPCRETGRGLGWAHKTQVYGAWNGPVVPIRFIPQRNAYLRSCPRHLRKCRSRPLYLCPGSTDPTNGCAGIWGLEYMDLFQKVQ